MPSFRNTITYFKFLSNILLPLDFVMSDFSLILALRLENKQKP